MEGVSSIRFRRLATLSLLSGSPLFAHGILLNSRMQQVRAAGPNGSTPATWNDTYYTYNQDSNNFPNYANAGYSYSSDIPDGKIAEAGINDGVHSSLNFSGLDTPSAGWTATAATAGGNFAMTWLATATHDPSHFNVYLTKEGFNPTTTTLDWADLQNLGTWSLASETKPVTMSTATNPAVGGTNPTYNWNITIPSDRSGREALVVIWQRDDPAGEAFVGVEDINVASSPTPEPALGLIGAVPLLMNRRRR